MTVKHAKRLNKQDHRFMAIWASDCAEHVLPYFEEMYPEDERPRKAIEAARAWARGTIPMVDARKAALASHSAARNTNNKAAQSAARAAGHAAATAHVVGHAHYAATFAVKSVTAAEISCSDIAAERDWQYKRLPEHLCAIVFPTLRH